ncbi:MAG: hypothetical protein JO108_11285 [Acidobacteriaceae bacterium]|nr:hypothetical protein [Acidobacteriaceae bacterium]
MTKILQRAGNATVSQPRFSRAIRTTSSAISRLTAGRPGQELLIHHAGHLRQ